MLTWDRRGKQGPCQCDSRRVSPRSPGFRLSFARCSAEGVRRPLLAGRAAADRRHLASCRHGEETVNVTPKSMVMGAAPRQSTHRPRIRVERSGEIRRKWGPAVGTGMRIDASAIDGRAHERSAHRGNDAAGSGMESRSTFSARSPDHAVPPNRPVTTIREVLVGRRTTTRSRNRSDARCT